MLNRRAFLAAIATLPVGQKLLAKLAPPGRHGLIIHGDGPPLFRSHADFETFVQMAWELQGGFNCRHVWIAKPPC
jgi:hypothetical protein